MPAQVRMHSIRRASSMRPWGFLASRSFCSSARPLVASSSRSPCCCNCRSASSASAKASTTCGRSTPRTSSRPCSPAPATRPSVGGEPSAYPQRCISGAMIEFHNVGKRYAGGHEALSDVSFEIARGEMVFLTGHSGAGKSTLLKLIALIERSSSVQVIVNDRNLNRLARRQIPYHRRSLGMIFQDSRLLQDRTVFDNVALPLVIVGEYDQREIGRRVRAALDKVGLLGKEKFYPVELSGGAQQRVGIARAVVHKPVLLVADEPTGNLDPALSREIMRLFEAGQQVGVTALIASHDLDLIASLPHRVLTHDQGRMAGAMAMAAS